MFGWVPKHWDKHSTDGCLSPLVKTQRVLLIYCACGHNEQNAIEACLFTEYDVARGILKFQCKTWNSVVRHFQYTVRLLQ